MCHPSTAQMAWDLRRRELLAEASEAHRSKACRRPVRIGPVMVAGMGRLGLLLIDMGMRLQGVADGQARPVRLAPLDPPL